MTTTRVGLLETLPGWCLTPESVIRGPKAPLTLFMRDFTVTRRSEVGGSADFWDEAALSHVLASSFKS